MTAGDQEMLLGRQPILDLHQQLVGYQLLFHRADPASGRSGSEHLATAAEIRTAFSELALGNALGAHKAFIHADERLVGDEVLDSLPAAGVVLALDFAADPDDALLTRCRALRSRGYTLALARYAGPDARSRALLPLVAIVKIDTRAAGDALADLVNGLLRLPLKLLAEQVDSSEQRERCRRLGFHLFQGYHFACPAIVSGRPLSASQLGIIRLLNLVARDADSTDLEDSFKREPGLTLNLLRLVNAVGSGQRVDSLRRAMAVLGRRQLLRWLQLLLMAAPDGGAPERNPLLQLAALRGRLMEVCVGRCPPQDRGLADQAFLAGIMSLMPAALGLPMAEIVGQIAVTPAVSDALTERAGLLGRLLDLVERLDANDRDGCNAQLAATPMLSRAALNASLAEALAWIHADAA